VRLAALMVLIIGNLFTSPVDAEDTFTQPLTRGACEKTQMAWDENANVCMAKSGDLTDQPLTRADCIQAGLAWDDSANVCGSSLAAGGAEPAAVGLSQPLTRSDCEKAGMTWNDRAHVCGDWGEEESQAATREASSAASTILINIDKTKQRMTVLVNGAEQFDWRVSTGLPGYATPSGSYSAESMNEMWYSREWDDAPMPHSVFFTKKGHAIHGTNEVRRLGKPASHGCVRLDPRNAATLYDLIKRNGLENTDVVLVGHTPGGEGKVARASKPKSQSGREARGGEPYGGSQRKARDVESSDLPRKKGGILKRLFGRR